jgi:inosose dehydratase
MSSGGIRVANAPCSWGILEFEGFDHPPESEKTLREMREAGYAGTELGDWGFLPTGPEPLKRVLGEHGLDLVGGFVPVFLVDEAAHAAGIEYALMHARLMAAVNPRAFVVLADDNCRVDVRVRNAGRVTPDMGLSDADWDTFAKGATAVAKAVRDETGLRTVFHHHGGGYVETPAEVAQLMGRTDPGLLGLCLDTGHWTRGGGDALAALREYGDRVWHVHFKDASPEVSRRSDAEGWDYHQTVRHGVFCELGRGSVDFPAILETLRGRGYEGWIVVEQDVVPGMGTPFESAVHSRKYLRGLGL